MANVFELKLHIGESIHSFTCEGGLLMVGRDSSCDVVIDSEEVALHHASLWLEESKIQVEDLTGSNGILVNGYDISGRVEVECPASIQVGNAVLVVSVRQEIVAGVGEDLEDTVAMRKAGDASTVFHNGATLSGNPLASGPEVDATLGMGPRSASVQVQYALGKEIARGGMGRIYKGEDPLLKREVAVKISSIGGNGDPRFAREAEVLGNLPHPNIVPIHAMGEDEDGFPFYSMKLVKGQTLQAIIKDLRDGDPETKKTFTRERLLMVFRKICDAMAFAHSKGILHRDLKPENVMVGEFGEVLVMDWGLAKKMGEADVAADASFRGKGAPSAPSDDFGVTMDGEVLGTPQYMSPEQAQGRLADLDERADIYSLGALLYSILTLRPPVDGDTLDELLTKVRSGQITSMATKRLGPGQQSGLVGRPSEMGAEVPEALRAVTRKAMALDPKDRYLTVAEFVEDIESYSHGYATRAEHAGFLRLLLLMVRRHRAVSALLALMFAGATAFTLKVIASERLAQENARIAETNMKKAAEEREHARRAAAAANMALVEAAERDLDGEDIQRILADIPPDLRDQKWEYLHGKLENSDFTAEAKGNAAWTAMLPHPQKPGVLVTLQSNGWVRTLDLKKQGGAIEDVFHYELRASVDLLAISRDASKVALVHPEREKAVVKATVIEVVQLASGKKLAELRLPAANGIQLNFNPDGTALLCIYRTIADGAQHVEVRNLKNELEWERGNEGGVIGEFREDGKVVRLFSERNGVLELDAKSGEEQKNGAKLPWPSGGSNFSAAGLGLLFVPGKDWSSVITCQNSGARFMRRFDATSGKVLFENRCLSIIGMVALPESNLIATLAQRSDRCVVLQYWNRDTGLLIKSMPLLGNMKGGWKLVAHPKTGDVAVINGSRLRAWNFQTSKPLTTFPVGARNFDFLGEPWRLVRTFGSGADAVLEILDTRQPDYAKKPVAAFKDPAFTGARVTATKSGSVFAVSSPGGVRIYRRKGAGYVETYKGTLSVVGPHWALNADGSRLWTGAGVYDTTTGEAICKVDRTGMDLPPNVAGLSDWVNAQTIVEIALLRADWPGAPEDALERAMVLWDVETGKRTIRVDAPDANGLCISPDGTQVCEAGNDMRLRLRNGQTLAVEREFRAHDGAISDVEWHPKLPLLVSSSEDLTVRIWNLKDGHLVEELHGIASQPDQRPERVSISPDGSMLAVKGGSGGGVGLYEVSAAKPKPAANPAAAPKGGRKEEKTPAEPSRKSPPK